MDYKVTSKRDTGAFRESALEPAKIDWSMGTPKSARYGEVYWARGESVGSGLEENQHVFIKGNNLEERFRNCGLFTIGELGFGFGINFFLTVNLWNRINKSNNRFNSLHYVAFEKHPIDKLSLERLYQQFPVELREISKKFLSALPETVPGIFRVEFANNIYLTLVYGDAKHTLPLVTATIDAWYLDGFSPRVNPDLWSKEIVSEIIRLSSTYSTLATYSVSGRVLEYFGAVAPKYDVVRSGLEIRRGAVVIGGGLAGAAAAYSLGRRGYEVTIVERHKELAEEASGNHSGVVMPYLSVKPDLLSRFYLSGFCYAVSVLDRLSELGQLKSWNKCGVLRLLTSKQLRGVAENIAALGYAEGFGMAVDCNTASEKLGAEVAEDALWFPTSGCVSPVELTKVLVSESCARVISSTEVRKLKYSDVENQWSIYDESEKLIAQAEIVVIANAGMANKFTQTSWLPLEPVRGQISTLDANFDLSKLKTVLCYDGYLTPAFDGRLILGATYQHDDERTEVSSEDEAELVRRLLNRLKNYSTEQIKIHSSRVSFRTMSPDRMPIIGEVPNLTGFKEAYLRANDDHFGKAYPEDNNYPGLYFSVGHGSRGLISCMLAGEVIGAKICSEPLPLEHDMARSVAAARFLIRTIKRGEEV